MTTLAISLRQFLFGALSRVAKKLKRIDLRSLRPKSRANNKTKVPVPVPVVYESIAWGNLFEISVDPSTMTSRPFPFAQLPFDVFLIVAKMLNRADLSSLCLASRAFEEMMTPALYASIEWNGFVDVVEKRTYIKSPCLAFARRPLLRNYVRTVILFSKIPQGRQQRNLQIYKQALKDICYELERLPALNAIRWDPYNYLKFDYSFTLEVVTECVARIKTLTQVQFPCLQNHDFPLASSFRGNDVSSVQLTGSGKDCALSRRLCAIESGIQVGFNRQFCGLRSFSIGHITQIAAFFATLKEMPNLTELGAGIRLNRFQPWNPDTIEPAQLKQLRNLTIHFNNGRYSRSRYRQDLPFALDCYRLLASNSKNLESLHVYIAFPEADYSSISADEFLEEVAKCHKASIRALYLDDMITTREKLAWFFSQCTQIQAFGLSAAFQLNVFDTLGPLAPNLEYLKLTIISGRILPQGSTIQVFMSETMPTLRRLDICIIEGTELKKDIPCYASWERQWLLDEEHGVPIQRIIITHWDERFREIKT